MSAAAQARVWASLTPTAPQKGAGGPLPTPALPPNAHERARLRGLAEQERLRTIVRATLEAERVAEQAQS